MGTLQPNSEIFLSAAERHEIERHKWFMSQRVGYDVGFEAAREDWQRNHAYSWEQDRQNHMLSLQREEIARHKWIESEKASCDMGRDACLDWIRRYAAQWRDWYEGTYTIHRQHKRS